MNGIHERNLPHVRIAACFIGDSKNLIGSQSQKSIIDLNSSNKIVLTTLELMITPILYEFKSAGNKPTTNRNSHIIANCIDNWQQYKKEMLLDDNIVEEKIDYIMYLIGLSSKHGPVKHSSYTFLII